MRVMVLVGVLEWAVIAAIVVSIVRFLRRRRDARGARQWASALATCLFPGTHLAFVRRVYQHGRRGSKAEVVWWETGTSQDAWFWGRHVRAGTFVAIRGGVGWGEHNQNPAVFYVEVSGVIVTVPGHAQACWARCEKRRSRRRRTKALVHT